MENRQTIMDKKSKKRKEPNEGDVAGNGSSLNRFGTVGCAECGDVIAYFPPNMVIEEENDLEFYCYMCATGLSVGEY